MHRLDGFLRCWRYECLDLHLSQGIPGIAEVD